MHHNLHSNLKKVSLSEEIADEDNDDVEAGQRLRVPVVLSTRGGCVHLENRVAGVVALETYVSSMREHTQSRKERTTRGKKMHAYAQGRYTYEHKKARTSPPTHPRPQSTDSMHARVGWGRYTYELRIVRI